MMAEAVVLFGAGGFVGRNIVNHLRGVVPVHAVTATGRAIPSCESSWAATDLAAMPALPPHTVIINVAARRYAATTFGHDQAAILSDNNAITDAVYRFALQRGITEVRVAGSSAVYPAEWAVLDDARAIDLNAWPHAGEAPYAWSKRWAEIAAELWHRRAGINTVTLRLTNPYGPFDTLDENEAHVATAFVIRAIASEAPFAVRGDPDAERDFVFAGDVAATFCASLELQGVQDAVNCARGSTDRVRDLAEACMRAAGRQRPLALATPPPAGFGGVKIRRATAARLRNLMPNLRPFCDLDSGLRATTSWYRDALRR